MQNQSNKEELERERERASAAALANALLLDIGKIAEALGSEASEPPALLADVRALKARIAELERERDEARAALRLALDGVHCACIVFQAACPSCVGRRVLRAADGGEEER